MSFRPHLLILACCCLLLFRNSGAAEKPWVAKVNGTAISAEALATAVAEARAGGQPDTPELRTALVQRLIAEELFWQAAKKQNLHSNGQAVAAAEAARRRSAIGQFLRQASLPAEPTDADVRRLYDTLVARLGPREYRVSVIRTTDQATLDDVLRRLAAGALFADEARRVSDAPSASRGGELDWLSFPLPPTAGQTGNLPLPVAQAIAALNPGEISPPLRLADGWVVLRLDAERATVIPDYGQAASTLRQAAAVKAAEAAGRRLALELTRGARIEYSREPVAPQGSRP